MTESVLLNILTQLNCETADITASAVISIDGILLASALRRNTHPDRVGAISAAMLELGNRATKELVCGKLKQVIVVGEDGYMLLLRAGKETVLVLSAKEDAKLGLILFHARQAAQNILQLGRY